MIKRRSDYYYYYYYYYQYYYCCCCCCSVLPAVGRCPGHAILKQPDANFVALSRKSKIASVNRVRFKCKDRKGELQYHESLRPTSKVFNRRDNLIDCFPTRVLKAISISKSITVHQPSYLRALHLADKRLISVSTNLRFPSSADVMYHDAENVISKQTRRCHSLSTL